MRYDHKSQAGFSLVELVIVVSLIGVIMGGAWTMASQSRQTVRIQQSADALAYTVDSARAAFAGQPAISGGISEVMTAMLARKAAPLNLLRSATSSCGGVTNNFADAPVAAIQTDVCGTFRVCAWIYNPPTGQSQCAVSGTAASQYLGIEFAALGYDGCVALAMHIASTSPPGLIDVYINGVNARNAGAFPVTFDWVSQTACTQNVATNRISYIYRLRAPVY